MKSLSTSEAIAFLKNSENPASPIMQKLVHAIGNLDRPAFDLLVENIVIRKNKNIIQRVQSEAYTELMNKGREHHRAYRLFTPEDMEKITALAGDFPWVDEFYIYAQDGYVPSAAEIQLLAKGGISIKYVNPQNMALAVLNYDLFQWMIDIAARKDQQVSLGLHNALWGLETQPSLVVAMASLLSRLHEQEFAEAVYGLFVRQGWAGHLSATEKGSCFAGVDSEGKPVWFRTQSAPTKEDFEEFYQAFIEAQKEQPDLRAYFCHQSKADPEYEIRVAQDDPDDAFSDIAIDAPKPLGLIALCDHPAWLRHWLMRKFAAEAQTPC